MPIIKRHLRPCSSSVRPELEDPILKMGVRTGVRDECIVFTFNCQNCGKLRELDVYWWVLELIANGEVDDDWRRSRDGFSPRLRCGAVIPSPQSAIMTEPDVRVCEEEPLLFISQRSADALLAFQPRVPKIEQAAEA